MPDCNDYHLDLVWIKDHKCRLWKVAVYQISKERVQLHEKPIENNYSQDPGTATGESKHIASKANPNGPEAGQSGRSGFPGVIPGLAARHQHQKHVSRLFGAMMSNTNPAVQYTACRLATNTAGASGETGHICIFVVTCVVVQLVTGKMQKFMPGSPRFTNCFLSVTVWITYVNSLRVKQINFLAA